MRFSDRRATAAGEPATASTSDGGLRGIADGGLVGTADGGPVGTADGGPGGTAGGSRGGTGDGLGRHPTGSPARKAAAVEPGMVASPWAGHELVRGYAVMVLPFSSGHLLGLRAWPQSSFGPYASVWHRPPGGRWSIYSDGPSLDTTCARYWGPATEESALADVEVTWTGPDELRVELDEPRLSWTLSASASPLLRRMNAASAALPRWTWKPRPLLRLREWLARRFLDMGDVRFAFMTPCGHDTVVAPVEVYDIPESTAVLEGRDLGDPVRLESNPTIGGVPLPTRPTFTFGEAHLGVTDPDEYRRTRARLREDGAVRRSL